METKELTTSGALAGAREGIAMDDKEVGAVLSGLTRIAFEILDLQRAISGHGDLTKVRPELTQLLYRVMFLVGADGATVYVLERDKQRLMPLALANKYMPEELHDQMYESLSGGLSVDPYEVGTSMAAVLAMTAEAREIVRGYDAPTEQGAWTTVLGAIRRHGDTLEVLDVPQIRCLPNNLRQRSEKLASSTYKMGSFFLICWRSSTGTFVAHLIKDETAAGPMPFSEDERNLALVVFPLMLQIFDRHAQDELVNLSLAVLNKAANEIVTRRRSNR